MMTKYDLVRKTAKKAGLDQRTTAAALAGAGEAIRECIESGESVSLPGLGMFAVREGEAVGRNFQTGGRVEPRLRLYVRFKPSTKFNQRLKDVLGGIKSAEGQI